MGAFRNPWHGLYLVPGHSKLGIILLKWLKWHSLSSSRYVWQEKWKHETVDSNVNSTILISKVKRKNSTKKQAVKSSDPGCPSAFRSYLKSCWSICLLSIRAIANQAGSGPMHLCFKSRIGEFQGCLLIAGFLLLDAHVYIHLTKERLTQDPALP